MSRYGKRVDLVVHEQEPFNAETGLAALVEGPLTATDAFYVRGHGAVPEIDPAAWRLRVHGVVENGSMTVSCSSNPQLYSNGIVSW